MPVSINGNTGVITGITAGGLPDGCIVDADINGMAASKLSGALPAISGASLTGISSGLSVASLWRVHTSWSGAADPVINWEAADNSYDGNIGTMSESSGIFTFPSTGMYGIMWRMAPYSSSWQRHMSHYIKVTTDGTNYSDAARGDFTIAPPASSNNHMGGEPIHCIFDVTNTTTHKVKFTSSSGPSYNGNGTYNNSYALFIRYGDT